MAKRKKEEGEKKDLAPKKIEYESLRDAEKSNGLTAQAIYLAIKKGELTAEKKLIGGKTRWCPKQVDIDAYLASTNCCEKRKIHGEYIFNIKEGRWSVLHAHKIIHKALGYYPLHHLYYLIRRGELRASYIGATIVLNSKDVYELIENERSEMQKASG